MDALKRLKGIVLIISLIFVSSCGSDDSNDNGVPIANTESLLSAKIGGEYWKANTIEYSKILTPGIGNGSSYSLYILGDNDYGLNMAIEEINTDNCISEGSHSDITRIYLSYYYRGNDPTLATEYNSNSVGNQPFDVEFIITACGDGKLSGTFSGTLYNEYYDETIEEIVVEPIDITEGIFDLPYELVEL